MSALRRRRYRMPAAPISTPAADAPGASESPSSPPAAARSSVPAKECPFCLAEIPKIALECPECRQRIAGAGSPADFRKRLLVQELVLREALREGGLDAGRGGLLGAVRLGTLLVLGVVLLCLTTWLLGRKLLLPASAIEVAMGIGLVGLVLLAFLVLADLGWVTVRHRLRPVEALAAFLSAMEIGRYDDAYACVLPGDRNDRLRVRRAVSAIRVDKIRTTFARASGFQAYWKPIFTAQDSAVSISRVELLAEQGDFAIVSANIFLSHGTRISGLGPVGGLMSRFLANKDKITLKKLVRLVQGRWYLVNGEMRSLEDDALEEFAVLAAAPDERLMELTRQLLVSPSTNTGGGQVD